MIILSEQREVVKKKVVHFSNVEKGGETRLSQPAAGSPERGACGLVPALPGRDLWGGVSPVPKLSGRGTREGGQEIGMTLRQMSKSYRIQADVLRHRIQVVAELPARTGAERRRKADRLRLLETMRREARDVAVICERYYERGYRKNERYAI